MWHPDPSIAPWISDMELEMTNFPRSVNDDRTDTVTQALNYLKTHSVNYAGAMAGARKAYGVQ